MGWSVINPGLMAEAGFFLAIKRGMKNNEEVQTTICYHCGVCLIAWRSNLCPEIEHARWSPRCLFLNLTTGKVFVNAARRYILEMQQVTSPINDGKMIAPRPDREWNNTPIGEMEKVLQMETDIRSLLKKQLDELICKVCYDDVSQVAFVPCGHFVTCAKCACNLLYCPMCRVLICKVMKIYRAYFCCFLFCRDLLRASGGGAFLCGARAGALFYAAHARIARGCADADAADAADAAEAEARMRRCGGCGARMRRGPPSAHTQLSSFKHASTGNISAKYTDQY